MICFEVFDGMLPQRFACNGNFLNWKGSQQKPMSLNTSFKVAARCAPTQKDVFPMFSSLSLCVMFTLLYKCIFFHLD